MRVLLTLLRRELRAYFLTPVGYVVITLFLVLMGLSFTMLIRVLTQGPSMAGLTQAVYGESLFFWIAMLMTVPVTTMRLFAEEARMGTLETLLTAPVRYPVVVLAKFLAAWLFFLLVWLPSLLYPWLLYQMSPDSGVLDVGSLAAVGLGIAMLGSLFIAIGLLASVLTRNQATAAMITLTVLAVLLFYGFTPYWTQHPVLQQVARASSVLMHMLDFSRGMVDSRAFVFYLSGTGLMLFAAVQVLESRRWRG
jgi:ABC-2 type transport system permease protein